MATKAPVTPKPYKTLAEATRYMGYGNLTDDLRGTDVVDPQGYRYMILEARETGRADHQYLTLGIDGWGRYWLVTIRLKKEGETVALKIIKTDSVFRHSIFDAIRDYAEAN